MQNSSYNLPGWKTTWQWTGNVLDGGYPQVTQWTVAQEYSFTYSGFGPNPDPLRKNPVAGSYDKRWWKKPHGNYTNNNRYWRTRRYEEGYMGGSYGDHFSSYGYLGVNSSTLASDGYMNWVYNECLDKFYENLKQTETNIALTLGEARESGRMLKVFRSVDKVVSNIRKARKLIKRNPSLLLAQTHLSIKYGWKPLFDDIWNYANWTYKTFSVGIPVRARRRKNVKVWDTSLPNSDGWQRHIEGMRGYSCEISVTCYVDDPDWFTSSRLTSLNPAAIAWELTTLSFVVDWLYDIGGYLENLENSLGTGLSFRRGYVTRTYLHNLREQQSQTVIDYYYGDISVFLESFHQQSSKTRNVLTGFPRPVKPTWKLRMGSGRILSAVALARTILLGKVR